MNTVTTRKTHRKSKVSLTIGAIIIATSAIAGLETLKTLNAPSTFTPATPTDSFSLDGQAPSDAKSHLEWQRCLVGQTLTNGACTGEPTEFDTWEKALNAPTAQQMADGWRVPNIKELISITENTQAFPAINTEVFPFATQFKFSHSVDRGQRLPASPSSPYIWSSTPVVQTTITEENFAPLSPEDSIAKTNEARKNIEYTYALDLGLGDIQKIFRSGESNGKRESTEYYNPDPDNVKKARYVLLVKDVS